MAKAKSATGGKSASQGTEDVRRLTREAALAALIRLAELARSEDERVALAASQELLNRAFGKSASAAADDPQHAPPLVVKIVRFGAEDIDAPEGRAKRPAGAER